MSYSKSPAVVDRETQAFSVMARLHVALRRLTGRVIDIEYMRQNSVYCQHILDVAAETANEDLLQLCIKLQEIYFGDEGLFVQTPMTPLLTRLTSVKPSGKTIEKPAAIPPAPIIELDHSAQHAEAPSAYVGRLR